MAANVPPRESTRFVAMFQKAHSQISALQRVDEQIATLMEQRRKATEELRAIQTQINHEFKRVLELNRIQPADVRSEGMDELVFDELKAPVEMKAPARESRPLIRTPALQATGS
jgi:chaperonin cofactor prefoldin